MIDKNNTKIGIVGLGYVGEATKHWFDEASDFNPEVFVYDKYKNIGSPDEVSKADFIFVCVPTPYEEESGYDGSEVKDALKSIAPQKVVIIKSSVVPGSTENFQKQHPELKLLFNPEFLRTKTAREDFLNPDRQIVGYTEKTKDIAEELLEILPKAPYSKIMPTTEAEMVKYFGNTFLATKVIFANQIYDLCKKLGIDYDAIKEAVGKDQRIGKSHLEVWHEGTRGYGGFCFPKDMSIFIDFAKDSDVDLKLHKTAYEINKDLRKGVEPDSF